MAYEIATHAHRIIESLGGTPPKVVEYANGTLIAFRNNTFDRVGLWIEPNTKPETVEHRIHEVFKVKAENIPSKETMAKFMKSADEIRKHQEAKKPDAQPKRDFGVKPER